MPDAETDEDALELRELDVDATAHGLRLDRWLAERIPEFSRAHLQRLIACGDVALQPSRRVVASTRLTLGDHVQVTLRPPPEVTAFRPEPVPLDIVFEDEHLMVIHKPAGLVMHPAAGHWGGTVLNGLLAHHATAATLPRAGIVHRLDKDTSGLFVVGKSAAATRALSAAIARRDVHREYLAVVKGLPGTSEFTVEASIARDPASRTRMTVLASGRSARTTATVLASAVLPPVGQVSALRCVLDTGRTHQIRVHMAHRGHPLLCDPLYGGPVIPGLARQALHARRLELLHPISNEPLKFAAPPPKICRRCSIDCGRWGHRPRFRYNEGQRKAFPGTLFRRKASREAIGRCSRWRGPGPGPQGGQCPEPDRLCHT